MKKVAEQGLSFAEVPPPAERGAGYLRKSDGILLEGKQVRLEFIGQHREYWPVAVLCRVLEVTRVANYKWLHRKYSKTQVKQNRFVNEIKKIHAFPRYQDDGSPRMYRELVHQGVDC